MSYVDGFLVPIPKKNIKAYQAIARKASKIWQEFGSQAYFETVLDDEKANGCVPFRKGVKVKPGETLVLAWIVYKSKAQRDAVNKKIMKDPRLAKMMEGKKMPFDMKRMMYGGFKVLVEA
jgi:uncharacterized protein YbaA (DUF1428 family)